MRDYINGGLVDMVLLQGLALPGTDGDQKRELILV